MYYSKKKKKKNTFCKQAYFLNSNLDDKWKNTWKNNRYYNDSFAQTLIVLFQPQHCNPYLILKSRIFVIWSVYCLQYGKTNTR